MKGLLREFKTFAIRGNVVDLAVGVIVGAAFGKITTSLVDDIIMPLLGVMTGGVNFSDKVLTIRDASEGFPALTLGYGNLLNVVLQFIIIAWFIFLFVKFINQLKRKEPAPDPKEKTCPFCKETIHLEATRCPKCTSDI